ncbi:MAG TPA: hypothetical protein PLA44_13435 [Propionibacteriaceae bacterium]|nr:hypothetical protein [Propionibacteriaceae bacterium]
MIAHVIDGQIVELDPPHGVRPDGTWASPPYSPADMLACDLRIVEPTPKPADTATTTSESSVAMVDGRPIQVWTIRPWTPAELAARQAIEQARVDIVGQALVWLDSDSKAATTRINQINNARTALAQQLISINNYTFAGTTVAAQINASLYTALKPQIASIVTRLDQIAAILAELNATRDRHGDYIAWLGKYVTGRLG